MRIRARLEQGLAHVTPHVICARPQINMTVDFAIDTGASTTTISYAGALALGINPKTLKRGPSSVGIGGSADTYRTGRATISFVGNTVRSFTLTSLDILWPPAHSSSRTRDLMESIPNLLGVDVLQHCKVSYRRRKHRLFLILELL